MEMISQKTYILNDVDKSKLLQHNYRYNKYISDYETKYFSYKFPALQYHNCTTVEGEIVINMETGIVRLNAYNHGTRISYPPFYKEVCTSVYEPIMRKINRTFINEFKRVGITEVGE